MAETPHNRSRSTLSALQIVIYSWALCFACTANAQTAAESVFRSELSKVVLGSESPIPSGIEGTFRGVTLVPQGAPWALPDEAQDETNEVLIGSSRFAAQFNYPVEVRSGVANLQRVESLERLWRRILSATSPTINPELTEGSILYRPIDRVDEARGTSRLRVPSEEYLRYLEYRSAWRILDQATSDDGAWRLHPRFSEYSTLKEARKVFGEEWVRFGYKASIETALEVADTSMQGGGWRTWLAARSAFESYTDSVIPDVPVGRTRFFPGETYWPNMRSWRRINFTTTSGKPITCQIARIEIERPWLHLDLLADKALRIDKNADLGVLSDGAAPTSTDFPRGRFANVIVEVILVRQIRGVSPESDHPLAKYADPDATNLVGYVIQTVPKARVEGEQ